jgi:hypothetical protein
MKKPSAWLGKTGDQGVPEVPSGLAIVRLAAVTVRAVSNRQCQASPASFRMRHSLTDDQLTALRLVRGDSLPSNPFERPQTRQQDRNLLMVLQLITRSAGSHQLTSRGAAYLSRIESEAGDQFAGYSLEVHSRPGEAQRPPE